MSEGVIDIVIPLTPGAKQSDKSRIVEPKDATKRRFIHHYQPTSVKNYQRDLAALLAPYVPQKPWTGPLRLSLAFYYPWRLAEPKRNRTRGWQPKHTGHDWENLGKPICDVMERLGFFRNDAQIADARVCKFWSHSPEIRIRLEICE